MDETLKPLDMNKIEIRMKYKNEEGNVVPFDSNYKLKVNDDYTGKVKTYIEWLEEQLIKKI